MSRRCEHGKDSQICVLCWEEANLEPRIMNEPTELQKVVERLENEMSLEHHDTGSEIPCFRDDINKVLYVAKQLPALQKENEELMLRSVAAMHIAEEDDYSKIPIDCPMLVEVLKLRQSRDSLQSALKECAKALVSWKKTNWNTMIGTDNLQTISDKALSNPLVRQALEKYANATT